MSEQTHKWLPDEPTDEMVNAAYHTWKHIAHPSILSAIRAMLKASWQAAPSIEQEPIAYLGLEDACDPAELAFDKGDLPHSFVTPLYTNSQPKD
jgi:hypothetical protein